MPVKRAASRRVSHDDPSSGDSSSRDDDFVIAPRPRRATRKATRRGDASSSPADVEVTNVAEGQAVSDAREARASDIIHKVERPLRTDYEYTLRRVDHHHPHRPTNFTRGEN
jgi:hypothetical protein